MLAGTRLYFPLHSTLSFTYSYDNTGRNLISFNSVLKFWGAFWGKIVLYFIFIFFSKWPFTGTVNFYSLKNKINLARRMMCLPDLLHLSLTLNWKEANNKSITVIKTPSSIFLSINLHQIGLTSATLSALFWELSLQRLKIFYIFIHFFKQISITLRMAPSLLKHNYLDISLQCTDLLLFLSNLEARVANNRVNGR